MLIVTLINRRKRRTRLRALEHVAGDLAAVVRLRCSPLQADRVDRPLGNADQRRSFGSGGTRAETVRRGRLADEEALRERGAQAVN